MTRYKIEMSITFGGVGASFPTIEFEAKDEAEMWEKVREVESPIGLLSASLYGFDDTTQKWFFVSNLA